METSLPSFFLLLTIPYMQQQFPQEKHEERAPKREDQ